MTKPDLGFYNHVISRANTDPKTTVFINDRQGNVSQPSPWDSMALDLKVSRI